MDEKEFRALLELAGVRYTARMYESYTYLDTADSDIAKICISSLEKRAWMRAVV